MTSFWVVDGKDPNASGIPTINEYKIIYVRILLDGSGYFGRGKGGRQLIRVFTGTLVNFDAGGR